MGVRGKILCIVGARPNFMKIAPIMRALHGHPSGVDGVLVHTGQHYDVAMNAQFFRQLRIPEPQVTLEVGSASHAVQTAEIMKRFEPVLDEHAPDCVLVVGDVNSTIACALVAAKKGVKVVHVEAGLRSRDRTMPEELNRLLTDQLSDRLYTTEAQAADNLVAEGIDPRRIVFAGNVMIDTLRASFGRAVPAAQTLAAHGAAVRPPGERYALLTLHRPSNVDDRDTRTALFDALLSVADTLPIVFPVHPRTRARIDGTGEGGFLSDPRVIALPPVGYLEMLGLTSGAAVVLTDSGGLQEESTALGVPCLTLRENTERPITIEQGTNTLVGTDAVAIRRGVAAALAGEGQAARQPEGWDGHAAERIVNDLVDWLTTEP